MLLVRLSYQPKWIYILLKQVQEEEEDKEKEEKEEKVKREEEGEKSSSEMKIDNLKHKFA